MRINGRFEISCGRCDMCISHAPSLKAAVVEAKQHLNICKAEFSQVKIFDRMARVGCPQLYLASGMPIDTREF